MLFLKLVERGAHNTMNICSNLGATKSQLSPFTPPLQIFQPSTLSHLPSSYPPSQIFQPTIPLPPPDHKIFQQDPLTRPPVTSFTSTSPCKILAHICQIPVKVVEIFFIFVQVLILNIFPSQERLRPDCLISVKYVNISYDEQSPTIQYSVQI